VGGDETLLDDSRLLVAYARKAGVGASLDVFPEQQHTFQMAAERAPEADDAIRRMATWVRPRLGPLKHVPGGTNPSRDGRDVDDETRPDSEQGS
jgi:acetyl esterase/lipase